MRNAFYLLRMCAVLMHPVAPAGTQMIADYLGFGDEFWSWEHIFEGNEAFCTPDELADGGVRPEIPLGRRSGARRAHLDAPREEPAPEHVVVGRREADLAVRIDLRDLFF